MMFYNNQAASMQRPPSRHKDPPQNLGLDLPTGVHPEEGNP
jgi:hypothetical protein